MNDEVEIKIELVGVITNYDFKWVQPQMGYTELKIKSNNVEYIFKGNEDSIKGVVMGDRVFVQGVSERGNRYGVTRIMRIASDENK